MWLTKKTVVLRELLSQSKKIILGKPIYLLVRYVRGDAPQETVRGPLMLMLIYCCAIVVFNVIIIYDDVIYKSSSQAFYLPKSASSVEDYCEETIIIIVISPKYLWPTNFV